MALKLNFRLTQGSWTRLSQSPSSSSSSASASASASSFSSSSRLLHNGTQHQIHFKSHNHRIPPHLNRSFTTTPSHHHHHHHHHHQPTTLPNTRIKLFRTLPSLRLWRRTQLLNHRTIGFVPTMGALHEGHLSLIRAAARENSSVLVSIYVNPTQFGISEDLASYPQTWDSDVAKLAALDRDLASEGANLGSIAALFAPTTDVMYPSGQPSQAVDAKGSFVTITPVAERLEGASRPSFFRGVATVCMKLFNIVQPERVYLGQKDIQQTVVLRKMVKDFCMGVDVVVEPTVREHDGLAMSSRNVYLGTRRRALATVLAKALRVAEAAYKRGCRSREEILGPAYELVRLLLEEQRSLPERERVLFEVDYLSLAEPEELEEVGDGVDESKGAVLSGAIKMLPVEDPQVGEDLGLNGGPVVRLIDNIVLKPVGEELD